ncbi:MAG: ATP-binding cassette domain-containing protein [Proteobacteria bacterium]|nr:ATP-binding cassette domain-containing protein [Pseudomonadota bacterium]
MLKEKQKDCSIAMPQQHSALLSVEGLSFSYDETPVLTDFSLQADAGEIVGLLGANGAGKTTALRLMAGILPPKSGKVLLAGLDVHNSRTRMAQKALGYLPENPGLYPDITAGEYLIFLAEAHKQPLAAVEAAMVRTACADVRDQPMETLSKGWRQRVYLAGVLMHRPRVLILDEPTDGLDPLQKDHMYTLLQEIKKDCAVLLSTHLLDEAQHLCDRLVVMAGGRIVAVDTPKNIQGKSKNLAIPFRKLTEGARHA